jgi:membrane-bound serine protease (ClpP class)
MTVITFALKAMRRPVEVGVEALIGRLGEARTDIAPRGMVQVAGELWSAEVEDGELEVRAGERVEVVGVEGLRLSIRSVVQKIS